MLDRGTLAERLRGGNVLFATGGDRERLLQRSNRDRTFSSTPCVRVRASARVLVSARARVCVCVS